MRYTVRIGKDIFHTDADSEPKAISQVRHRYVSGLGYAGGTKEYRLAMLQVHPIIEPSMPALVRHRLMELSYHYAAYLRGEVSMSENEITEYHNLKQENQ